MEHWFCSGRQGQKIKKTTLPSLLCSMMGQSDIRVDVPGLLESCLWINSCQTQTTSISSSTIFFLVSAAGNGKQYWAAMISFPTALPEHQSLRSLWSFTAQRFYIYSLTWNLWVFLSLCSMHWDMEKGRSELGTFPQSSVTESQAFCVCVWALGLLPTLTPGTGTSS